MYQTKPVVVQTSNFGGAQGTYFNDNQDATGFPNSDSGLLIDPQRPIQQIQIRAGWVIDTIVTKYRLTNGTTKTAERGSKYTEQQLKTITLNDTEIVSQISGFAGNYPYYKNSLVIQLSLVITDTKTGVSRVAGPFGAGNGTAEGKFFSVSDPLAFSGFQTGGSDQTGISGLSIIKSNNAE